MNFIRVGVGDYVNVGFVARVRLLKSGEYGISRVELEFLNGQKQTITGDNAEAMFDAATKSLVNTGPNR